MPGSDLTLTGTTVRADSDTYNFRTAVASVETDTRGIPVTVTDVNTETGVITLGRLDNILREVYTPRNIDSAAFTVDSINLSPTRTNPNAFQLEPTTWRFNDQSDAVEARFNSYANTIVSMPYFGVYNWDEPTQPAVPAFDERWIQANAGAGYSQSCWRNGDCGPCGEIRKYAWGVWSRLYGTQPKGWAQFWENLGIAHTAAVFMLELHWNPKEHKFDNADAIRAHLGL